MSKNTKVKFNIKLQSIALCALLLITLTASFSYAVTLPRGHKECVELLNSSLTTYMWEGRSRELQTFLDQIYPSNNDFVFEDKQNQLVYGGKSYGQNRSLTHLKSALFSENFQIRHLSLGLIHVSLTETTVQSVEVVDDFSQFSELHAPEVNFRQSELRVAQALEIFLRSSSLNQLLSEISRYERMPYIELVSDGNQKIKGLRLSHQVGTSLVQAELLLTDQQAVNYF